LQALDKSLDFIIDTASGEHPFDPYITTLKTAGVLVLVGAPSEMKLTPLKLLLGKVIYTRKKMQGNVSFKCQNPDFINLGLHFALLWQV
jgi:D-arabinose 1-dehydrogenase-like Zn-dependent alcohol dehydrogenase